MLYSTIMIDIFRPVILFKCLINLDMHIPCTTTTTNIIDVAATICDNVDLTANISPTFTGGTVTFYIDNNPLVPVQVIDGIATTIYTPDTIGIFSIRATFNGATIGPTTYCSSTSELAQLTIFQVTTTTSVTVNPDPSIVGTIVTITATVTPTKTCTSLTGSVQFEVDSNIIATVPISGTTASTTYQTVSTGSHTATATYINDSNFANSTGEKIFDVLLCIHASSQILMADGSTEMIHKLKSNDLIKDANNNTVPIKEIIQCWLKPTWQINFQKCIIFEPSSLDDNVPSSLLAIDLGHPIATPSNYAKYGQAALKPAYTYKKKQLTTWDRVATILPDPQYRYDLVLSNDSCQAYLANNVVIQARASLMKAGYKY